MPRRLPLLCAWLFAAVCFATAAERTPAVENSSPLEKAKYLQQDLLEKHWLDGLYVSIVPSPAPGH